MSFKLQLVQEIERAQLTTTENTKKFGDFDWKNQTPFTMLKSPEKK